MKQLTCEMCGSTDLLKQDGVFVCQSCGCKYSIEEAKKMMVEGTVEVTGTVKVDNSAAIANYLKMAKNALEASNHEEAEEYANKIIELDPRHCEAWMIKGEAAGWQSTAAKPRLSDAVTAWLNAIEYADDPARSQLRENIANKYTNLMLAMVKLRCEHFSSIPNEKHRDAVQDEINDCVELMDKLTAVGGVSFNRGPTYNTIATIVNGAAVAGYKAAQNDFGPEHSNMAKWQWERFTGSCGNCCALLAFVVQLFARDASLAHTICDNLITIAETARDSCSWKFNVNSWNSDHYEKEFSFAPAAKAARNQEINRFKEIKNSFHMDAKEKTLDTLQGGRICEEEALARTKYWEEHTSEKEALEGEKASLEKRMQELTATMENLPIRSEIEQKQREIAQLHSTLSGLGLFKGKEKKELQARIAVEEDKLSTLNGRLDQDKKPLQEELSSAQTRIAEIAQEFSRSRGRISTTKERFIFKDAIKDGKLTITPEMFFEHLKSITPSEYEVEMEPLLFRPIRGLDGTPWHVSFKKAGAPEGTGSAGVMLLLFADTQVDPITAIALPAKRDEATAFCKEAAYVLMALSSDEDIVLDDVEDDLCDIVFSEDRSLFEIGEFRAEYVGYYHHQYKQTITLCLIRLND